MRLLLLLVLLAGQAWAQEAPPIPLPPLEVPAPLAQPLKAQGPVRVMLGEGWNLVSFPAARVGQLTGSRYPLIRHSPEGFVPVDPAAADVRRAYFAYGPGELRFEVPQGPVPPLSLHPGWNLVGCPSDRPIRLVDLSVTGPDGNPRVLEEAATPVLCGGQAWLARYAFSAGRGGQSVEALELGDPASMLKPTEGTWLYAYTSVQLHFNQPRETAPAITGARYDRVLPGQPLSVLGQGLDQADTLTLAGVPIPAADIVERQPDRIGLRLPAWARSGNLVAYRGTRPSNRLNLRVEGDDPVKEGLMMGEVQDPQGRAIPGAQVQVGERSLTSGPDGRFYVPHMPPGPYPVVVSAPEYRTATGAVNVRAGHLSSLLTTLSPVNPPPGSQAASLWVKAYPFQLTRSRRFWVKSIRIWELGNYRRRTYNSWWIDASSRQLGWDDAPLGRWVRIEVVWTDGRDERWGDWDRLIQRDSQSEYIYSPWD